MRQSSSLLLGLLLLYPLGIWPQETALPPLITIGNTSFTISSEIGCGNLDCEAAVCAADTLCCVDSWSENCVLTAFKNLPICPLPKQDNIVCAQSSDCCNQGLMVGEWTEGCVVQAQEFCPK